MGQHPSCDTSIRFVPAPTSGTGESSFAPTSRTHGPVAAYQWRAEYSGKNLKNTLPCMLFVVALYDAVGHTLQTHGRAKAFYWRKET
jgi:hypothetical protein